MWGILLIAISLSFTDADILNINENHHEVKQIADCVVEISSLRKYSKHTIVLYEPLTVHFLLDIFKREIADLFIDKQIPFIMTNNLNEVYKASKNYTPDFLVVIYHQSCDNEIDILVIKNTKYLIVFEVNTLNTKCYNIFMRTVSEYGIYDVTFAIRDTEKVKYNIITSVPELDEETCDFTKKVTIKYMNTCFNSSLEIKDEKYIFPSKKPNNLKLCKLNVGMADFFPYSTIENKETLQIFESLKQRNVYGSDIEIMKIFTNYLNATLDLYFINRDTGKDLFFHTEYMENLLNGTLDVFAGGLYNIYGNIVDSTGIYTQQSIIWIYTVERKTRSWQIFLEKTDGLYIFLIFQVCYSLIWKLLCRFDGAVVSLNDTILYSLGALIGTTSLHEARTIKQKIANISFLLLCIHLSSYINTQMYYYLTIEDPPQTLKTLDELTASDRTPYLVMSRKYFLKNEKYTSFANTSRNCDDFEDCERLILKNKGATIILDGYLPPFQSSSTVDGEARVMRVNEDVLVVYHEMMMRKDSPLVYKLPDVVARLFEAGICDKLYYEAIGIMDVDKAKIAVKNMLSSSYSCTVGCKITMSQLAGAFYLWAIGGILSCCIFILEILIKRQV